MKCVSVDAIREDGEYQMQVPWDDESNWSYKENRQNSSTFTFSLALLELKYINGILVHFLLGKTM